MENKARYDMIGEYFNGFCIVSKQSKMGFLDKDGNLAIPIVYEMAMSFSESLAGVCINNKWGFINTRNELIIPCQYDFTTGFDDGLAPVQINKKWGFINKQGTLVIPAQYDSADMFCEALTAVHNEHEKWGFINKSNQLVIPYLYDDSSDFSEGLAMVILNEKTGYINKLGNEVIPCIYKSGLPCKEGLIAVTKDDNTNLVLTPDGKEVPRLSGFKFQHWFEKGLAVVESPDGRLAMVDKDGRLVCPYTNEKYLLYNGDLIIACRNNSWGAIDINNKTVIPFNYRRVDFWDNDGILLEEKDGNTILTDMQGNVINTFYLKGKITPNLKSVMHLFIIATILLLLPL